MKSFTGTLPKQMQFASLRKHIKIPILLLLVVAYYLTRHFLLSGMWFTFTDEQYNFSLEYPAAWNAHSYGENGSRISSIMRAQFTGRGSVFIFQQSMENPNLEDAVAWGKPRIQRNDGYDLSPLQEIQIGPDRHPALTQTYRIRGGLGEFARVVYFVTNDSVFMIEFNDLQSRFEKNEPTFERMLASFQVVE